MYHIKYKVSKQKSSSWKRYQEISRQHSGHLRLCNHSTPMIPPTFPAAPPGSQKKDLIEPGPNGTDLSCGINKSAGYS